MAKNIYNKIKQKRIKVEDNRKTLKSLPPPPSSYAALLIERINIGNN